MPDVCRDACRKARLRDSLVSPHAGGFVPGVWHMHSGHMGSGPMTTIVTGSDPLRDLRDQFGRPLRNLRLSVTDRCNLRCSYCMPEAEYAWLPREDILHFEEMSALVDVFAQAGVDRIRLTGGEPLLRRDL